MENILLRDASGNLQANNIEGAVWEGGTDSQQQQESPGVTPLWHFNPAVPDKRKCWPLESTRRLSENDTGHKQTGYTPVVFVKSTHANVFYSLSHICSRTTVEQGASCCSQQWWAFSLCLVFALLHNNTQHYTNHSFNYHSMWLLVTVIW